MAGITIQKHPLNQILYEICYWPLCKHAQNWEQTGEKKKKILKYSSEFQILSAANRRKSHVH